MGGDDFITKPFDLNVLTAKVGALTRRTYSFQGRMNVIEHKGVMLNLNDTSVSYKGRKAELTKNELKILQLLMENAERVVSREDIMQYLWESDSFIDDNTLTVNMTRLRKKLASIGLENFIATKKGLGYIVE
jgi:DNA-binding response OmpR family regulator